MTKNPTVEELAGKSSSVHRCPRCGSATDLHVISDPLEDNFFRCTKCWVEYTVEEIRRAEQGKIDAVPVPGVVDARARWVERVLKIVQKQGYSREKLIQHWIKHLNEDWTKPTWFNSTINMFGLLLAASGYRVPVLETGIDWNGCLERFDRYDEKHANRDDVHAQRKDEHAKNCGNCGIAEFCCGSAWMHCPEWKPKRSTPVLNFVPNKTERWQCGTCGSILVDYIDPGCDSGKNPRWECLDCHAISFKEPSRVPVAVKQPEIDTPASSSATIETIPVKDEPVPITPKAGVNKKHPRWNWPTHPGPIGPGPRGPKTMRRGR